MSFEDLLKSLQQEYLASLPQKIEVIRGQAHQVATLELRDSFHKLKGTGRTYGLPEVSELAEIVENICLNVPKDAGVAALHAAGLLQDICESHLQNTPFQMHQDPRFEIIRSLLPS